MSVREFIFMIAELVSKDIDMAECENCFKKTKESAEKLFNYLAKGQSEIQSETMTK